MRKKPKSPFFIIGCNRSGTSLLRTMLNHHPLLAVPPESVFFIDYIQTKKRIPINIQKMTVLHEPGINEWGIKLKKSDLNDALSTKDIFSKLHEIYTKSNGKKYWGNKTPRFTTECVRLKKLYPEAVFIHIVRDPRATVLSLKKAHLIKSNIYFGSRRWLNYVCSAVTFEESHKKDTYRVFYEDLVHKPKEVLTEVCSFLNIKYCEEMMSYNKKGSSEYPSYNRKLFKNLAKLPFSTKVNYWKKIISKREVEIIEGVCFDLMNQLGYKPLYKRSSIKFYEIIYYNIERFLGFSMQVMTYAFSWPKYFVYTVVRKILFGTFFSEAKKLNY